MLYYVCVRCDLRSKPFSKRYSSVGQGVYIIPTLYYDIVLNKKITSHQTGIRDNIINRYYIPNDISFKGINKKKIDFRFFSYLYMF